MTLQDWGALGELIGGAAIIVSLLYVGLQVRHGTIATRAATNQAFSQQYSNLIMNLTRREVGDVFYRGLQSLRNLQGFEQVEFMALMASIMRTYETFYFEREEGRFESKMYDGYQKQLFDIFGNEGVREYWEIRKHQFAVEFVAYIDEQISNYSPKPMYRRDSDKSANNESDDD